MLTFNYLLPKTPLQQLHELLNPSATLYQDVYYDCILLYAIAGSAALSREVDKLTLTIKANIHSYLDKARKISFCTELDCCAYASLVQK